MNHSPFGTKQDDSCNNLLDKMKSIELNFTEDSSDRGSDKSPI